MRVLLVKTSSMGDLIHTLPAITDAQQNIPEIRFDWIAEEVFSEIPLWHQAVDQAIPVAIRRWRKSILSSLKEKEWLEFYHRLTATKYDYIIDAQGLIKSAIITKLAKGKKCGLDYHSAREPLASWLYQNKFSIKKDQHAIARIRQLFALALGYTLPSTEPEYRITLPHNDINNSNYAVFIHGASREEKCWPEEEWIQLTKHLETTKYQIKLPWGNEIEHKRAENIAANCENATVLAKTSLTEIAKILQKAKFVITVDTGIGHIAAALNIPSIALYGKTNPELIGTIGKNQIHLCGSNTQYVDIPSSSVWEQLQKIIREL